MCMTTHKIRYNNKTLRAKRNEDRIVQYNTNRSQHGCEEEESIGKREEANSPDSMDTMRI